MAKADYLFFQGWNLLDVHYSFTLYYILTTFFFFGIAIER